MFVLSGWKINYLNFYSVIPVRVGCADFHSTEHEKGTFAENYETSRDINVFSCKRNCSELLSKLR